MKSNLYSKAIVALFIGLAFAACTKTYEYVPAEPEDASKTYVGADITAARSIEADGTALEIPFVRNTTTGDLEVSVVLDDPSGLFSLASQTIKFANGEKTASAKISYSYDALVSETIYNISVALASAEYASEYRPVAFPVACKKAWQNLGIAQFYDGWWVGGPFEKTLLKAPDGSETYRLVNPWDQKAVEEGGLTFVSEIPYLEFSVDADGIITYDEVLNMGFTFQGYTCHMLHPSKRKDAESAAENVMLMDKLAQFCWYPVMDYDEDGYRWWGKTAYAYLSFPGGPDLNELLK